MKLLRFPSVEASAAEVENAFLCRGSELEPEKKLMLAVLQNGVACYQKYVLAQGGKGERLFREAEEWILEENSDWPFCFDRICEALDLNPGCIREGLLRWRYHRLRERDPLHRRRYLRKLRSSRETAIGENI